MSRRGIWTLAAAAATRAQSALVNWSLARDANVSVGMGCRFNGRPIVDTTPAGSHISIGDRVVLTSASRSTALGVNHPVVLRTVLPGALITVGANTGISGGSICAARRITIGSGCLLGANVTIVDTDFHPVHYVDRRYEPCPAVQDGDEVVIGNDVFVGAGAIILRGSRVGDHAVIGAHAVVTGWVEAGSIVAGNPARAVGSVVAARKNRQR